MYALYLLIAVAAFGLWYGLTRLFDRTEDDPNDQKEDHHGKQNEHDEHQKDL